MWGAGLGGARGRGLGRERERERNLLFHLLTMHSLADPVRALAGLAPTTSAHQGGAPTTEPPGRHRTTGLIPNGLATEYPTPSKGGCAG